MFYFIFAVLIVLADQAVKYLTTLKLALGGQYALIPGVVRLIYVQNTGAAFSFFSDHTWILTVISTVAAILIIFIIIRTRMGAFGRLSLAAVLGGALGNLVDRLLLGYVVDMIEVEFLKFGSFSFPVFNIADIFITVGGISFCIYYLIYVGRGGSKKEKHGHSAKGNHHSTNSSHHHSGAGVHTAGTAGSRDIDPTLLAQYGLDDLSGMDGLSDIDGTVYDPEIEARLSQELGISMNTLDSYSRSPRPQAKQETPQHHRGVSADIAETLRKVEMEGTTRIPVIRVDPETGYIITGGDASGKGHSHGGN